MSDLVAEARALVSGWVLDDALCEDDEAADAALIAAAPGLLAALADEVERVGDAMLASTKRTTAALVRADKAEAERDEARADLESAWAKAGEMLDSDAGMEAYTAADAMEGIIGAARNENEDERDAMCAVVEAARRERRTGTSSRGIDDALDALDAATGEEASDGEV